MTDLSENFAYAIERFGRPQGPAARDADLAALEGHFPSSLVDFWREVGFGVWMDGYFQVCNPLDFRELIPPVFGGDPDFDPARSHVIGLSGFGELTIWNEDHRTLSVNMLDHSVRARSFLDPKPHIAPSTTVEAAFILADNAAQDEPDDDGEQMFDRARAKLGPLSYGQIFTPVVHPLMGGKRSVDALKVVDAKKHLLTWLSLAPFMLTEYSSLDPKVIREIGGS